MHIFKCEWNGHVKHVEALNLTDAEVKFEEKMGFYPSPDLVDITITTLRTIE